MSSGDVHNKVDVQDYHGLPDAESCVLFGGDYSVLSMPVAGPPMIAASQ
jgi:hypothetical protein